MMGEMAVLLSDIFRNYLPNRFFEEGVLRAPTDFVQGDHLVHAVNHQNHKEASKQGSFHGWKLQ
jgi:hypothetical protein